MDSDELALNEADLHPDPFVQFGRWYDDALAHGVLQPDAMVVATSSSSGRPSVRMVLERAVLLGGSSPTGFGFFTNLESRKGGELAANPHAAIAFHWPAVLRQVRATGPVEPVDDGDADTYWATRPRASQLSAWASTQSAGVGSRAELEAAVRSVEARFGEDAVPRPSFWGGFRVIPDEVEFWQHRDDRLHDRLRYTRHADGWAIDRLQP